MPFTKGQSGNPSGRPKRTWSWAKELEKAADEHEKKTGTQFRELVAKRVVLEAANGNMIAAKELFNRMDGMPKQDVEHSGGVSVNFHPSLKQNKDE